MLFGGQAFVDTAVFSARESAELAGGAAGFRNTADTDPTVAADRAWGLAVLDRVGGSIAGDATAAAGRIDDEAGLDEVVARVCAREPRRGARWPPPIARACCLRRRGLSRTVAPT